ncbi:MAG TPA: replication-relaxation family protein [Solirubrobacteraceae bacterium]|nr:replication-relaxation family protein [Solirubrobacteraceae bacterium]HUA74573.1 replication-relaxation family protein [Solirubrobacteraceae bacterium]
MKEIVRPRRLGVEDMLRLASHLTERDRRIAKDCFEFRVLTSSQITRLYFSGARTATARLEVLYGLRVLDRFRPSLPMGEGSAPYHWILDEAGALIVADHLGLDRDELGWQHSVAASIATSQKLRHHVEVNELFTRLSVEASAAGGELSEWYGERSCSQMFSGKVIPDGYGVLALPGRAKLHLLIELDRASEPSARLRKKAADYERHLPYSALRERDVTVLLLVPSARRAQTAAAAVAESAAPIVVAPWSGGSPDSALATVLDAVAPHLRASSTASG